MFKSIIGVVAALLFSQMANSQPLEVVVFGDSLSAGYQLQPSESLPAVLQKIFDRNQNDISVGNASVSGDTTATGLQRMDWSVPEGVGALILELGANDFLRGKSIEETRSNLTKILIRARERNIPVFIVGMQAPRSMGEVYWRAFDDIYPSLAKAFGTGYYPFYFSTIFGDSKYYLEDGLHPNAIGVEKVAADLAPKIEAWLVSLD